MQHFSGTPTKTDTSSVSTGKAQLHWRWKMGSRKDFFQLKKSIITTTQISSFTKTDEQRREKISLKSSNMKNEDAAIKHRTDIPKASQDLISIRLLTHLESQKWRITEEQKPCTVFLLMARNPWSSQGCAHGNILPAGGAEHLLGPTVHN